MDELVTSSVTTDVSNATGKWMARTRVRGVTQVERKDNAGANTHDIVNTI